MSTKPKRVIAYARVSSAEQALGTSLTDQQNAITAYAETRGLVVSKFYVEAESAIQEKIERREQMQALMRDVRAGDLVVCDKLDRWSRDPEFTYSSVRKILAAGASFYAVADRVDPSTSDGDTSLGFRILFAREEHKRIRERTVGTRKLLRAQGYYVEGQVPFGYRRSKPPGFRGLEKNILTPVPEEVEILKRMFAMSIAGESLNAICTELGLEKKRVWSSLRCRTYLGEIKTDAGWIKGRHPAVLTASVWERANASLTARRHGGPRPRSTPTQTDSWFLRELARCGKCGGKMTSAYGSYFADGTRRYYYRCWTKCAARGNRATNGSFVPVAHVEATVSDMIADRLAELRDELARGPEPVKRAKVDYASKRERLDRKRARHLEAHAEGLMSLPELRTALAKVDTERTKLEAAEGHVDPAVVLETRRSALREVDVLRKAWSRADPTVRRGIARRLLVEVRMVAGESPVPIWRTAEELSQ